MDKDQHGSASGVVAKGTEADWSRTSWPLENHDILGRLTERSGYRALRF